MIDGLTQRAIADLIPYAQNARTHSDEQVRQIADSITEYGWTNPILVDEEGNIIAGHGRVLAAQLLEATDVPCITLTGLTEIQKRAYVIADNKLALNAGWDERLLQIELTALKDAGFNLDLSGFSSLELKGLIGPDAPVRQGKTDDDEVPAPPPEPIARPGDIWILGRHKLMVGDATNQGDVQRLMGEEHADLVWTDPPYNVAYEGQAGKILNDDMGAGLFKTFLTRAFTNCYNALKPGGCIYVSHADTERVNFTQAFLDAGLKMAQVLIWVKQSGTLSRQDYNWQHEPILYGWREGAGHFFAGNFTQTTVIDQELDISKLKIGQVREMLKELLQHQHSTVIREDRPAKSELHPTMKPVSLVQRMVESSSREGEIVLDPFGGSGTTLITAEKSNRICRTMELDPKFADVIINRWQNFTGKEAKTLSGLVGSSKKAKSTRHKG